MSDITFIVFLCFLPVIAFLYASVGHGGASGYLALMALCGFTTVYMKPTALMLNCMVSLISFIQFYRHSHLNWRLFIAFSSASIPMAFIGGGFDVNPTIYKIVLGILLLVPAFRLWIGKESKETTILPFPNILAIALGAIIGFLSGLIGIGGGILLSPIILHFKWANFKQTAGISALFIFVNSIAGLFGNATHSWQQLSGLFEGKFCIIPMLAIAGGVAGGYFGAGKFNLLFLKKILALVLIIASIKLILT